MIIKNIVDDRKKTGRREEDALQFLLDQNDSMLDIITVSIYSLQLYLDFQLMAALVRLGLPLCWPAQ